MNFESLNVVSKKKCQPVSQHQRNNTNENDMKDGSFARLEAQESWQSEPSGECTTEGADGVELFE
jgi:hypothetical protein